MSDEIKFHVGVKALVRNSKGEVLLLKVHKDTIPDHPGAAYWDIPGGRVKWDSIVRTDSDQIDWEETIKRTLKREVAEETGITTVEVVELFSFDISNISYPISTGEIMGLILRTYICRFDTGHSIDLSEEHSEYRWFAPEQAANRLSIKYPTKFCDAIAHLPVAQKEANQ